MDFLTLAKKRYSARTYSDRPVEPEKLDQLLTAARVAPTGKNLQPYHILVVQSPEGMEKVAKAANTYHAPLVLIICGDYSRAWKRPWDGQSLAPIDASIITDHMMLEAADIGLDSVWICNFKPDILREEFKIPEGFAPVNLLAVGYTNGQPKSPERHEKDRVPVLEFVSYETFSSAPKNKSDIQ